MEVSQADAGDVDERQIGSWEMTCTCVRCPECNGSGNIVVGNPLNMPFDDIGICCYCGGCGLSETCEECLDAEQRDEAEDWE